MKLITYVGLGLSILASFAMKAEAQQDSVLVWTTALQGGTLTERVGAAGRLAALEAASLPPGTQSAVISELGRMHGLFASTSPVPEADALGGEDLGEYYLDLVTLAAGFGTLEADLALVPAVDVSRGIQRIIAQRGDVAVPLLDSLLARGVSVGGAIEALSMTWFWADSVSASLSVASRHAVVRALLAGSASEDFGIVISTAVALGESGDPAFLPFAEYFASTQSSDPTARRVVGLKAVTPLGARWEATPTSELISGARRIALAVCEGSSGARLGSCQAVLAALGQASDLLALRDTAGAAAALATVTGESSAATGTGSFSSAEHAMVGSTAWAALERIAVVAPTADFEGPAAGAEGQSLSFDGSSSRDHYGTLLSLHWEYGDETDSDGVVGQHSYADEGSYQVVLTATDEYGLADTVARTVQVTNVAPTVTTTEAPLPTAVGLLVAVGGGLTDPGIADTHSVFLDWGEGTVTPATVMESGGAGTYEGAHAYSNTGVYQVTVTVQDDDGASVETVLGFAPVYDPNGGFVTGGGWINSPTGAYLPDPAATGKANFGFVSRYQHGAQTPDGETQFRMQAAGLTFHSTAYDWLVVAGARAQFKGVGRLNGTDGFGFMLTAVDSSQPGGGSADRFRIKIWSLASGDVVYDNQRGDDDDAGLTTALGGGRIQIHQN